MKAVLFLFVLSILSTIPAFAADVSPPGENNTVHVTELYSDIESFDVTLYSTQPEENLSFEVLLISSERMRERTLDRQVLLLGSFPAGVEVRKVGFWNVSNPERGAYIVRARLLDGGQVVSELEYNFAYGSSSAPKLQVNDLVPNSQGISVALSPKEASLFDIEYMLISGSDVVYSTKSEKLSLTSAPDIFSAPWGTLLENNKEYVGRVKIQTYSPQREFISSSERFTARDDAEITYIYEDETGASATVFGRSQVPFEGNLTFSVYGLAENSGNRTSGLIESIRARIPVLLNNEDETIEVAWNERLPEGVYRLEIELLGNDGDIIERRETIIESDLSAVSNVSQINDTDNGAVTPGENDEDGIPGFSSVAGIIGLILVSVFLRKTRR
ncbi:hypothetical protein SAMN02910340_01371 [Methanosarcina thermophila]|jgi:hypothetical protein|uniref:Uncharacterized protein n=3 Tax=Methanosarcina thermophila TaxID=2210 RepID=A0A1I6Z8D5_METTE|nr:hypothetical protein [Methanosarcina thermophila]ALK06438.1 MAG: hypothetical protein AAY43_13100 [Methanosarcina sp. 795]AKB11908.1 hypothetical protein MSTHT_0150 [Methanosarcina thermophila TM-1]AKB14896.1 hypothetical protein MSTHC_0578 [Methanosarcina thermophila CHTI-55]NLU55909.1 hypothetical protein [Methanosarcina thermophila]SFT58980.1 hypothetical protein SAMN02910340_01371 [Methanosarcina thermophila]